MESRGLWRACKRPNYPKLPVIYVHEGAWNRLPLTNCPLSAWLPIRKRSFEEAPARTRRQGDESVVDSPWRLLKIVALWNIENNYGRMNDEIETSISLIRYLETCCNWEEVQQFLNFRHRCLKFNYITCIKEIKMKATYRKRYIMQRKK